MTTPLEMIKYHVNKKEYSYVFVQNNIIWYFLARNTSIAILI